MAAAAQVLDMALVTVLHILTEQRRKKSAKQISFTGTPAAKTAAKGAKHYEPGDLVEHKVFGRGQVVAVKPAAGDQIVEINFEKVGIKRPWPILRPDQNHCGGITHL